MLKKEILSDTIISEFSQIFSKYNVFLVGGYIRDLFFKKVSPDRDLVILDAQAKILADEITEKSGGTCVLLDEINQIYRVVLPDKINYFDISNALNNNLFDDAKRRDFTLNSVFFNLNSGEILDPFNGLDDIKNKIIKTADLNNLSDDSLRLLRALRFSSTLNFKIDKEILDFISKNYSKINNVAAERVNYELIKMFEGDFVVENLRLAHKLGLLSEIFPFIKKVEKIPENTHHHLPLLEHSFETINNLQMKDSTMWPFLKIAALMHDIGKPEVWTIEPETSRHRFIGHDIAGENLAIEELKRLKFSRKQIDFISKMVLHHIYPSALMHQQEKSDKALIRFVRKLDPYVPEVIDLARADRLSAQGPAISKEKVEENLKNLDTLLKFYEQIKPKLVNLPKLLDGNEIMQLLNIGPQKRLGEIIVQLNEAQLEGLVNNKEQAIEFVKTIFQNG